MNQDWLHVSFRLSGIIIYMEGDVVSYMKILQESVREISAKLLCAYIVCKHCPWSLSTLPMMDATDANHCPALWSTGKPQKEGDNKQEVSSWSEKKWNNWWVVNGDNLPGSSWCEAPVLNMAQFKQPNSNMAAFFSTWKSSTSYINIMYPFIFLWGNNNMSIYN